MPPHGHFPWHAVCKDAFEIEAPPEIPDGSFWSNIILTLNAILEATLL